MPTAWVQGSPLTAEVYELIDYPAKGFALELNSVNQLDRVADNVYKGTSIINDLALFEIPTNGFGPVGPLGDGWDSSYSSFVS